MFKSKTSKIPSYKTNYPKSSKISFYTFSNIKDNQTCSCSDSGKCYVKLKIKSKNPTASSISTKKNYKKIFLLNSSFNFKGKPFKILKNFPECEKLTAKATLRSSNNNLPVFWNSWKIKLNLNFSLFNQLGENFNISPMFFLLSN